MSEATEVRIGDCICPTHPHPDGDAVTLRPMLGLAAGIEIQRLVVESNQSRDDAAIITGKLAEAYLLHGVESWTLVNADGRPIPVNADSIRLYLLSNFAVSAPIADVADDLYMVTVIGPLVERVQASSPSTSNSKSTSANPGGKSSPRKPSKRSSTSTTPTGATAITSE